MNQLGIALVWCALQVSVLGLIAAVLYAAARRWGPTARSHIALAGILLVLVLTALAFSPWPRWQFARSDNAPQATAQPAAAPEFAAAQPAHGSAADAVDSEPLPPNRIEQPSVAAAFWTTFVEELGRPQAAPEPTGWRWPSVVAALFLAGAAFGMVRLLAGWWTVGVLRRKSKPIHHPALLGLLDVVQAELSCRRPIELRESDSLVTAATIGWRKPLILLPAEWPDWTEAERHAVLAHEIAHIGRHDFAAWIFAECGLVLHFYHPLVHWLAGRLRLEQELAADAAAAAVTGGQRPYLTTLAAMALRQPDRSLSWPARTFLPTRRTFLRRIEMLRDSTILNARASAGLRCAALGLLFLAGLGVAGLRGPVLQAQNEESKQRIRRQTRAADNSMNQPASGQLKYIPKNAIGVFTVRVADVYARLESPQLRQFLQESEIEKQIGIPLEAVRRATFVYVREEGPEPQFAGVIVETQEAGQPEKIIAANAPGAVLKPHRETIYYSDEKNGFKYLKPGERTVIAIEPIRHRGPAGAADQSRLDAFVQAGANGKEWTQMLAELDGTHAAAAFELDWISQLMQQARPGTPQAQMVAGFGAFAPIWENGKTIALGVSLTDDVEMDGVIRTESQEGAQRVQQTLQALVTLARNLIGQGRQQIAQAPPDQRELMTKIVALGEDLLKSAQVTQSDSTVRLQAKARGDGATALVAAQVFPAISKARETAQRTQSMNNLKQIALAMHNYHDTFGHFPAASILGPDGKTPHSWRVALLPFLEQAELYNQYRLNEPWDSENNRKVLEKMPVIYRNPKMPEDTTTTAYFVLTSPPANGETGLGTSSLFSSAARTKGPSMREVTDGTSNTLLTVETRRDVPWTKPEDISVDPEKELPEFGGFYEDGWAGGLGDGSVRFFQKSLAKEFLRRMLTPAGGELPGVLQP